LEPEIYSFDILDKIINEGHRQGVTSYPVHIKLDTGMHRLGFLQADMPRLIKTLQEQNVVTPRSVFSHLAAADCLDMDDYTQSQFDIFVKCSDELQSGFPHHILRHILNSTGITRFPQYQFDLVRLGICLYGIPTLPDNSQGDLQPVSTLRTTIIAIKEWPAGTTIGYSRKGVLHRDSRIATLPIGYADGLNRHFGNGHATMLINGHRCPTVGNICMDVCMVDVTDANCNVGDQVEVFGQNISVTELADTLDTIPYEILTSVSTRVKRVYYRE
jgi:alanine racemase